MTTPSLRCDGELAAGEAPAAPAAPCDRLDRRGRFAVRRRRPRCPASTLDRPGAAFLVAAVIAMLNAVLPPLVAALRLPFTLALGFVLVLLVDALALLLADDALPELHHGRLVRRRAARGARDGRRLDRAPGRDRAPTTTTSTRCA